MKRKPASQPQLTWLYRTMETDDNGDLLDWGAVKAHNRAEAVQFVTDRLRDCCDESVTFQLYETHPWESGVIETGLASQHHVEILGVGAQTDPELL